MWLIVKMLPCAPYISSMCQPVQSDPESQGPLNSSPRDTEVKMTDVKSIKVDLVYPCDLVRNENKVRGSVESIPKEFSTFKPESPDIIRAAKILENSRKISEEEKPNIECDVEDVVIIKTLQEERKEQEKLGAISKR